MKLAFYIERIIDFALIFLMAISISFCLPILYALLLSLISFILFSYLAKKTPAMLLFKKQFSKKPGIIDLLKTLLFLGKKGMDESESRPLRTFVAGALAICALVGGFWGSNFKEFSSDFEGHQKNAGWEYYISQEKGFTIQLPENPSVETRKLYVEQADKTLDYNEYKSVVTNNTYYSVSFMDFPSRWRFVGSNKLLNAAFDILVKSEGEVKLVSKDDVQHKIYPAIEFILKKGDEEWRGRLILVGNTFYKIMRVSSSSAHDDSEFDDFLRSFQFPTRG